MSNPSSKSQSNQPPVSPRRLAWQTLLAFEDRYHYQPTAKDVALALGENADDPEAVEEVRQLLDGAAAAPTVPIYRTTNAGTGQERYGAIETSTGIEDEL